LRPPNGCDPVLLRERPRIDPGRCCWVIDLSVLSCGRVGEATLAKPSPSRKGDPKSFEISNGSNANSSLKISGLEERKEVRECRDGRDDVDDWRSAILARLR